MAIRLSSCGLCVMYDAKRKETKKNTLKTRASTTPHIALHVAASTWEFFAVIFSVTTSTSCCVFVCVVLGGRRGLYHRTHNRSMSSCSSRKHMCTHTSPFIR